MSVEEVLSEILRVPCWNVKFTRESSSQEFLESNKYVHGLIRCYLEFTTKRCISEELNLGSIRLSSQVKDWCGFKQYKYTAILLKGEETSRIVRAIADELV